MGPGGPVQVELGFRAAALGEILEPSGRLEIWADEETRCEKRSGRGYPLEARESAPTRISKCANRGCVHVYFRRPIRA